MIIISGTMRINVNNGCDFDSDKRHDVSDDSIENDCESELMIPILSSY